VGFTLWIVPRVRFAPSPTGHLHLGHAYSAWRNWQEKGDGSFLLRIEDIDARSKPEFEVDLLEDLAWLGFEPSEDVVRQSSRGALYGKALDQLKQSGLMYPCFCSRKQIKEELERLGSAPQSDGVMSLGSPYPGTCKKIVAKSARNRVNIGEPHVWRLDLAAAVARYGAPSFLSADGVRTPAALDQASDPILGRRDTPFSYHLCCVVDDADQGIELVIRGRDLLPAVGIHRLIQQILGLAEPRYLHHPLVLSESGERLSKRTGARSIREYRREALTPDQVIQKAISQLESSVD